MKNILIAASLAASSLAGAAPAEMSQHPRSGELCEISFDRGSTRLPDEAMSQLGEVAGWALANPDGVIVLDGHAQADEPALPLRLSRERAEVVRDRLVAAGVDPDRIVIAGFGSEGPAPGARVVVWATRQEPGAGRGRLRDAPIVLPGH